MFTGGNQRGRKQKVQVAVFFFLLLIFITFRGLADDFSSRNLSVLKGPHGKTSSSDISTRQLSLTLKSGQQIVEAVFPRLLDHNLSTVSVFVVDGR